MRPFRRFGMPPDPSRLEKELQRLRKEMRRLRRAQRDERATRTAETERLVAMLRLLHDEEPSTRRRLYELRTSPGYELAYTEHDPLVSVVIPTYTSHVTLVERALPSVLGQTYANLEVVVVGDGAPPETGQAMRSVGDERVTYWNRERRGPYPPDRLGAWWVSGVPAYNEAVQRARGAWIAPMSDDDAMRPDHIETLLASARAERDEVSYGLVSCVLDDGTELRLGQFPPRKDLWYAQASINHAGLGFMGGELGDALFGEPSDVSLCRRMLRAGVRFGFVDAVVTDYWWRPQFEGHLPPVP